MDLSNLSNEELKDLQGQIVAEQKSRRSRIKSDTKKRIRDLAEDAGFSLDELFGAAPVKTKSPAKVKYRDPANEENTWAGRGRKPKWLEAYLSQGRNQEDFAV